MTSLGIITITYSSYGDVRKTLRSITPLGDFSIIYVIHKELTEDEEENLKKEFSLLNVEFFKQEKHGIYDAMNRGIKENKCDYIYFLNAGDECFDANDVIGPILDEPKCNRVLVFDSMQIFGEDNYLRSSERTLSKREYKKIAHQAVIAPTVFAKENIFSLKKPISADTLWIEKLLVKYPYVYIKKTLTKFYLGGISNYPSFKSVSLRYEDGGFRSLVNEIIKLVLRLTLGNRGYYRIMCLRKKYF